jgi:hypothetical protein
MDSSSCSPCVAREIAQFDTGKLQSRGVEERKSAFDLSRCGRDPYFKVNQSGNSSDPVGQLC